MTAVKDNIIRAGQIAKEIKIWIKPQIKKGMKLLEIAELIEDKIYEMDAKPAFPTNLSINEQAAHFTPAFNDESVAHGLLKVDFGVHVDGWIADNAFSIDLDGTEINKKLIESSKAALTNVENKISSSFSVGDVGRIVEETIHSYGFNPIANLSGHSMDQYNLHAGTTIPNVDNNSTYQFKNGLYAIEPFATNGNGSIHDGPKGNIYAMVQDKPTRSPNTRKILNFIKDTYGQIPFASRWLLKEFGPSAKIALMQLEREEVLHHYAILIEEKGKLVSQCENTFLISEDEVIITTKED